MTTSPSQLLRKTAGALVAEGKGILAADEGSSTINQRFAPLGIVSTGDTQRAFREMLFTTPGIEEFISGVILFDDTIRQTSLEGRRFTEILASKGIITGINVDKGIQPLALTDGETITDGLDGLRERLGEYRELGAGFAKWRAALSVGIGKPSGTCVRANAHALARYAALCQEAGLTPIVEPDVVMGGVHTIEASAEATGRVLEALYGELYDQHVDIRGTLLKPNMVLSGFAAANRAGVEEVAEATLDVLYQHVPAAVPGIVFLSGGQSDEDATAHLNAMNRRGPHPWPLSFSYSCALQLAAIKRWGGKVENVSAAQSVYYHRAKMNSAACLGSYSSEMDAATSR